MKRKHIRQIIIAIVILTVAIILPVGKTAIFIIAFCIGYCGDELLQLIPILKDE